MSLFTRNVARCGMDIDIESRSLTVINTVQTMAFEVVETPRAIVKTIRGVKQFDGVNTEDRPTHEICVPFSSVPSGITAENWVKLKGRRLRILNVENCCEKDEVFILTCTERGDEVKSANSA